MNEEQFAQLMDRLWAINAHAAAEIGMQERVLSALTLILERLQSIEENTTGIWSAMP